MNPVVIPLDGDAGDTGILERLQGFDGSGEGLRQDLTDVKQVAADQDSIDWLADRIPDDTGQARKEIGIAL